jgi:peptidoglycan-associated lipoprotein
MILAFALVGCAKQPSTTSASAPAPGGAVAMTVAPGGGMQHASAPAGGSGAGRGMSGTDATRPALEGFKAANHLADVYFEFDRADIRPADQGTLDRKAAVLAANPNVRLRIAGHADDRGSDEYNLALGNRRAAAAKRYLENKGVDGSRVEVVSYGEERPLNPGTDESAYAQNRRDEFEIPAGGDNLVAPL